MARDPLRTPLHAPARLRARQGSVACTTLLVVVAALAALLAACSAMGTPERSPLAEGSAVPTVPPGVTSYPPPFPPPLITPTPVPTADPPDATPVTSPAAGDPERAAGRAIEVLAERMAVSATRLSVVSVEPVDWPDGCLGAAPPGLACTAVVTPGYRVTLRYDTGSLHELRTGRGDVVAWVAQATVRATVRPDERADGALALTDDSGADLAVLLAPGTQRLDLPPALQPGDRVRLGVDDVNDGSPLRAVWIAPDAA